MDKHQTRRTLLHDKTLFISCVVPVYNECETIQTFVKALHDTLSQLAHQYEIILIDDGSKDDTLTQITALTDTFKSVKFLSLSRNFGKEIALTAGISHATGDVVILLDADFQHPLEVIPVFLSEWANGYDMVYAVRQDRESESFLKRKATQCFYFMMNKFSQLDIQDGAGDFRLMDKKLITALNAFPERTRFMKGLYAFIGFDKIAIPYEVQKRNAGTSRFGVRKLTELALTGLTSFSDIPLRIWSLIGFVISAISLIYAIFIVTETLIFGTDLPGFPSLIVAIMFLGGIQLLSIGILGEYIARIFTEVKHRPLYLVKLKKGFDSPDNCHQ